jgi:aspartate carbamoyltransferase catalytic subunit
MTGERDHGVQPMDGLMEQWVLSNHDLVEASPEQLNHKQVQKARKGRQLTLHSMQKVTRALNIAIWNRLSKEQKEGYFEYHHHWLFNYAKGYQENRVDPNDALKAALRAS